jgi:hypothetical protein
VRSLSMRFDVGGAWQHVFSGRDSSPTCSSTDLAAN